VFSIQNTLQILKNLNLVYPLLYRRKMEPRLIYEMNGLCAPCCAALPPPHMLWQRAKVPVAFESFVFEMFAMAASSW
jgi:hypothetical protein